MSYDKIFQKMAQSGADKIKNIAPTLIKKGGEILKSDAGKEIKAAALIYAGDVALEKVNGLFNKVDHPVADFAKDLVNVTASNYGVTGNSQYSREVAGAIAKNAVYNEVSSQITNKVSQYSPDFANALNQGAMMAYQRQNAYIPQYAEPQYEQSRNYEPDLDMGPQLKL